MSQYFQQLLEARYSGYTLFGSQVALQFGQQSILVCKKNRTMALFENRKSN